MTRTKESTATETASRSEIEDEKEARLRRIAELTLYHYKAAKYKRGLQIDLRKLVRNRDNKY